MENNLDIADRLTQFIDYLGISERKFSQNVGLSNGLLGAIKKGGSFGVDKLEKILVKYPELNTNWLLFGKGEMILQKGKVDGKVDGKAEVDPEEINTFNEPDLVWSKPNEVEELKKEIERLKIENAAYLKAFEAMGKANKPVESANRNVG